MGTLMNIYTYLFGLIFEAALAAVAGHLMSLFLAFSLALVYSGLFPPYPCHLLMLAALSFRLSLFALLRLSAIVVCKLAIKME